MTLTPNWHKYNGLSQKVNILKASSKRKTIQSSNNEEWIFFVDHQLFLTVLPTAAINIQYTVNSICKSGQDLITLADTGLHFWISLGDAWNLNWIHTKRNVMEQHCIGRNDYIQTTSLLCSWSRAQYNARSLTYQIHCKQAQNSKKFAFLRLKVQSC